MPLAYVQRTFARRGAGDDLSVPSAGLWAEKLADEEASHDCASSFSTLCGPMG